MSQFHDEAAAAAARREQRVGQAFVALADTLVDDYDVIDLLDRLVGHCTALLAAEAAGLMLADARGNLRVVAASSEDAELMDLIQLQAEQGPCLDCFHTAAPVSVAELTGARERWPVFVDAAVRRGPFASVHALPLRLRGQAIGALNLFHRTPGALPAADLVLGQALADVATIGILQERAIRRSEVVNEQLQGALNSRVVIEQAKGVIAQAFGQDLDAAFDRLRRYARSRSARLAEVARQVVAGELATAALEPAIRPTGPPRSSQLNGPSRSGKH